MNTVSKFDLLVDLGTVVLPDNYVHETCLTTLSGLNRDYFIVLDDGIDDNFKNSTQVLRPRYKIYIRVFHQVVGGTTTWEERMAFLATQNAVHTGAQGLLIVFDQKRDQLPKDKWYASFDEKDRLEYIPPYHKIMCVYCDSDNSYLPGLSDLEGSFDEDDAFICITLV